MLAGNDLLKIDEVLKMNMHKVLVFLEHQMDRQELEAEIRENQMNKNKNKKVTKLWTVIASFYTT